jgi:hypothetical protein
MARPTVSDTDDEARRLQAQAARRLGPDGRVALAIEMSDDLRRITLEGLRERNPGLSEDELVRSLIRLWHGVDVTASPMRGSTAAQR